MIPRRRRGRGNETPRRTENRLAIARRVIHPKREADVILKLRTGAPKTFPDVSDLWRNHGDGVHCGPHRSGLYPLSGSGDKAGDKIMRTTFALMFALMIGSLIGTTMAVGAIVVL